MANDLIREFLTKQNRYVKKCKDLKYYKYKIKIIKDFLFFCKKQLGKRKINELIKKDLEKFLNFKRKELSETTIRNYRTILNSFFKRASLK